MTASRFSSSLLACATAACSGPVPLFPTSVEPPAPAVREDTPARPATATTVVPFELAPAERLVQRFFLALATGDKRDLHLLLSPEAQFNRPGSTTLRRPAVLELEPLIAKPSNHGDGSNHTPQSIRIVDVRDRSGNAIFVIVNVGRPESLEGLWTFQLQSSGETLVIEEIFLPRID